MKRSVKHESIVAMSMRKKVSTSALATFVLALVCFSTAQANEVAGSLWLVPEATAQNATIANVPLTSPNITFDVNSPLNFNSGISGYTENEFLTGGGAFNIVGSPSDLGTNMDNGTTGTLISFTGTVTVTNGESFTVEHDDGLTLMIDGVTVINATGPTSAESTTETYTGPSGNEPFQLVYGECCGAPAVLQVNLPLTSSVPEPSSLFLLGSGLAGLLAWKRKIA